MNSQEQANHNKLVHELDELRGDLIEARNENESLKRTLRHRGNPLLSVPEDAYRFWAILWLSVLCGVTVAGSAYIYDLRQELAFWKCQPPYQSPSAPVEN